MNRTAVSATPPAFKFLTLLFLALTNASIAGAADPDPHGMQAAAVHALLEQGRDEILFIDVRDPIEIQFVGFTDEVDANIPFLLADQTRWNAERGMFLMDRNPRFAAAVHEALAAKGLGKDATIITLCRSGSDRGMPSAAFLRNNGFANSSYVIHGFQGDPLEDGPQRGMRLKNGWQNSGLPWSPSLNPEKIHRATAKAGHNWMVVLSSGSNETQAMALILARAEAAQGTPVRILLCDDAGMMAVEGSQAGSDVVQPLGMSPRQLLAGLIQMNAVVELCGIFAQTREIDPSTFIQGVAVASPPGIARQISDPDTKVLSF